MPSDRPQFTPIPGVRADRWVVGSGRVARGGRVAAGSGWQAAGGLAGVRQAGNKFMNCFIKPNSKKVYNTPPKGIEVRESN